jgi:hypothetical protein
MTEPEAPPTPPTATPPPSTDELTYWDFVKEALNVRPELKALGKLPVNWMALAGVGTLGLLNPGFWLVGAGLELAFVVLMAQNPRFRNYVRGRRIQAAKQASAAQWRERQQALLAQLSPESQKRFEAFVKRIDDSKGARADDDMTGLIGDVADDGLHRLRWIYLRLLASAEGLEKQVDPSTGKSLQAELDATSKKLEALGPKPDIRIQHSLEQTVDILKQRLKNLEDAKNTLVYIESELRRVEHQAELIIEEAALATDADTLSSRIDAVTATFHETQEWMHLHKELLSEFGDDEDDDRRPPPQRALAK